MRGGTHAAAMPVATRAGSPAGRHPGLLRGNVRRGGARSTHRQRYDDETWQDQSDARPTGRGGERGGGAQDDDRLRACLFSAGPPSCGFRSRLPYLSELAQAVRAALDEEYADYDPAPGRGREEDDAIGEALTTDVGGSSAQPSADTAIPPRRPSGGWVTDWSGQAACRTTDPDELFVQGAAQNRPKAVCTGCPVRTEYLADALDYRVEFGVWGGMTERERRALLRRRPTMVSWRALLETARREYERGAGILPLEDEDLTTILSQAV